MNSLEVYVRHTVVRALGAVSLGLLSMASPGEAQTGAQSRDNGRWSPPGPPARRFVVLASMNREAVLDRETGLVWERNPAKSTHDTTDSAQYSCLDRDVAGRRGWRLPSVPELMTLMGPAVGPTEAALVANHPFDLSNVYNHGSIVSVPEFWTTTMKLIRDHDRDLTAMYVRLDGLVTSGGADNFWAWCVRGPASGD
jgi:hypothetical protein